MLNIFEDIANERKRQDEKWGADRHMHQAVWFTILSEEVGEVANEICESGFNAESVTDNYRNELIQVAAVAIAMIEDYDRHKEIEQ